MWPFKPKPAKPDLQAIRLARARELFPIGREFGYLGLRMRVTGHKEWSYCNSTWWACLRTEYVCGSTIKSHTLTLEEAEALHTELTCAT